MDRAEYKTKLDEVRDLIRRGKKDEAFAVLGNMNWRKVHNVNALLQASEIYEKEGRYEDAGELLEIAHERSPIGRMIIYRLANICIELKYFDEAREYYDEFVDIAPHDSLRYVIQYKLNKAKGADNATLISILEELKEHDFIEEWAYELALLYHHTRQAEKCVALCDEIILWFGEGPYVERAMDLKLIYTPLTEQQQDKYRQFQLMKDGITEIVPGDESLGNGDVVTKAMQIPEISINPSQFSTINLQEEIKKNIEEIMHATETGEVSESVDAMRSLVKEVPYAKVEKEPTKEMAKMSAQSQSIDDTLKHRFREYLQEELDGQMSLMMPQSYGVDTQIEGQITMEEVYASWQITSRAAKAALDEAHQTRLENAKEAALEEATEIVDRLAQVEKRVEKAEEALRKGNTFSIPKVDGGGVGFEVPVVSAKEARESSAKAAAQERPVDSTATVDNNLTPATPPAQSWQPNDMKTVQTPQAPPQQQAAAPEQVNTAAAAQAPMNPSAQGTQSQVPVGATQVMPSPAQINQAMAAQQPVPDSATKLMPSPSQISMAMTGQVQVPDGATQVMPSPAQINQAMAAQPSAQPQSQGNLKLADTIHPKGLWIKEEERSAPPQQDQIASAQGQNLQTQQNVTQADSERSAAQTSSPIMLQQTQVIPSIPEVQEPEPIPEGVSPAAYAIHSAQSATREREALLNRDTIVRPTKYENPTTLGTQLEAEKAGLLNEDTTKEAPQQQKVKTRDNETAESAAKAISQVNDMLQMEIEKLSADMRSSDEQARRIGEELKTMTLSEEVAKIMNRRPEPSEAPEIDNSVEKDPDIPKISTAELPPKEEIEKEISRRYANGKEAAPIRIPKQKIEETDEEEKKTEDDIAIDDIKDTSEKETEKESVETVKESEKKIESKEDSGKNSKTEDLREGKNTEPKTEAKEDKKSETGKDNKKDNEETEEPEPVKEKEDEKPEPSNVIIPAAIAAKEEEKKEEEKKEEEETTEPDKAETEKEEPEKAEPREIGEPPQRSLTPEERAAFTYFGQIRNVEKDLCRVLPNLRKRLTDSTSSMTGNVIISGADGCGKTTLATALIKVLKSETGRPHGPVGRINADRLNSKDMNRLFEKISGGTLIIEHAGELTNQSVRELSALLETERSGILIIIEDHSVGIERALSVLDRFTEKFTERISIPMLTIDELANFGRSYALDIGYKIDEMGVLALYDRINEITANGHPTNLVEIKEIIDDAIDNAERGGIRGILGRIGGGRHDEDGNLILQERDFI